MKRNNPKGNYLFMADIIYKVIVRFICICLIFTLNISCSTSEKTALEIGGFTFGSSKQEAINIAKTLGYDIEPNGEYHLYLTGAIKALDAEWDLVNICVDPINGVKEIRLTMKNSSTTPEIKTNVYRAITKYFPKSERCGYIESITGIDSINGNSSTIQSDYATLFELIDDRDEYSGSSYYILSRDEFSTVIGLSHPKDHLNNSMKE